MFLLLSFLSAVFAGNEKVTTTLHFQEIKTPPPLAMVEWNRPGVVVIFAGAKFTCPGGISYLNREKLYQCNAPLQPKEKKKEE